MKYYEKYHKKMSRLIGKGENNFSREMVENWRDYFYKRIQNEDQFLLYAYTRVYKGKKGEEKKSVEVALDLGRAYLNNLSNQNDYFEGIGYFSFRECSEQHEKEIISDLGKAAYIKCFSENPNDNLLWGHYADRHKGYCIEYDLTKLKGKLSLLSHLFPISYVVSRPFEVELGELSLEIANNDRNPLGWNGDVTGLFICKDSAWRYEREWRLLCEFREKDEELFKKEDDDSISIEFPCVSKIIIGRRMSEEDKEIIYRAARKYEQDYQTQIEIYKLEIEDSSYEFTEKPINRNVWH